MAGEKHKIAHLQSKARTAKTNTGTVHKSKAKQEWDDRLTEEQRKKVAEHTDAILSGGNRLAWGMHLDAARAIIAPQLDPAKKVGTKSESNRRWVTYLKSKLVSLSRTTSYDCMAGYQEVKAKYPKGVMDAILTSPIALLVKPSKAQPLGRYSAAAKKVMPSKGVHLTSAKAAELVAAISVEFETQRKAEETKRKAEDGKVSLESKLERWHKETLHQVVVAFSRLPHLHAKKGEEFDQEILADEFFRCMSALAGSLAVKQLDGCNPVVGYSSLTYSALPGGGYKWSVGEITAPEVKKRKKLEAGAEPSTPLIASTERSATAKAALQPKTPVARKATAVKKPKPEPQPKTNLPSSLKTGYIAGDWIAIKRGNSINLGRLLGFTSNGYSAIREWHNSFKRWSTVLVCSPSDAPLLVDGKVSREQVDLDYPGAVAAFNAISAIEPWPLDVPKLKLDGASASEPPTPEAEHAATPPEKPTPESAQDTAGGG